MRQPTEQNNIEGLIEQANQLRSEGKCFEAAGIAERVLSQKPLHEGALLCAGRAFLTLGMHQDAERRLSKLRRKFPANELYTYLHAQSLFGLGRDVQALKAVEACLLVAEAPAALRLLLQIQIRALRYKEVLETCQRLVKAEGPTYDALLFQASALMNLGLESESFWNAAIQRAPLPEETHFVKARNLQTIGDFEEAEREFRRSIEIQPIQGRAYSALFAARKVDEADRDLIAQIQRLLQGDPGVDAGKAKYLHFALGKAFDNLGDYATAIEHYDEANRLVRQTVFNDAQFAPSELGTSPDEVSRLFTREFIGKEAAHGSESQVPIFVIGMMRSGTTLLEQVLSSHPDVGGAGEQRYWGMLANRFIDYRFGSIERSELQGAASEYLELLQYVVGDRSRIVDKNPANFANAGLLHIAFPKAKIIFMHRNPLDVAMSIWTTPMETSAPFIGDREAIVAAVGQAEKFQRHWQEVLPESAFLNVKYENLVGDREAEIRRVLQFCELEECEACFNPEQNQRIVRTPSFWQVRQKVYKTSVDRNAPYAPWLGAFEKLRDLI